MREGRSQMGEAFVEWPEPARRGPLPSSISPLPSGLPRNIAELQNVCYQDTYRGGRSMQRRARARTGRPGAARSGFTLIELLTVIAIIAILVALLFPVFATVRRQMNQSSCMSNMHQIVQAMQMYKDDHHVYPECLYDFIDTDPTSPWKGQLQHRLYPNYVKDPAVFHCPNNPIPLTKDDQLGGANKPTVQATDMMTGQP